MPATKQIDAMTAATALGGTEEIPGVQSAANVKITPAQIKTFTSASPTLVTPVLGVASRRTGWPDGGGGRLLILQTEGATQWLLMRRRPPTPRSTSAR